MRVIERDGASGVTHRNVAREAQLPNTATTYYFDGVEDMLTAALTSSLEEDARRFEALSAEGGPASRTTADGTDKRRVLAGMMAEIVTGSGRGRLLAEFELCLLAARRPELRSATRDWAESLAAFARLFTDDPKRVKLFAHSYDGLLLQGLLADEPPAPGEFEELLYELLPGPSAA